VIEDLGARCVAEKDFVGLAPYLAGMGQGLQLCHLRYLVAVAEEGSLMMADVLRLRAVLYGVEN
jgi:hypothetical protein